MLLDGEEVANSNSTGTLKYEGELAAGSHNMEFYG
jgi:hypothetical protein